MTQRKLIVITAPSGAGKTSIARYLLEKFPELSFSISATTRKKRDEETEGKDYFFITPEQFKEKIDRGEFVEWEEVYHETFYGTLRSELERIWQQGKSVLFDVDVKGALNLKKIYPAQSFTIFIKPPSITSLINRLQSRATESPEKIAERIRRAEQEIMFEPFFDAVVVNDNLGKACHEAEEVVKRYMQK